MCIRVNEIDYKILYHLNFIFSYFNNFSFSIRMQHKNVQNFEPLKNFLPYRIFEYLNFMLFS